jgi:hypothetical protein
MRQKQGQVESKNVTSLGGLAGGEMIFQGQEEEPAGVDAIQLG